MVYYFHIGAVIVLISLYIDYYRGIEIPEDLKETARNDPLVLLCAVIMSMFMWPYLVYGWIIDLIKYFRRRK